MSKFHVWRKHEDEVVCAFALARKTDDATIKAITTLLGLTESQVAFRMTNYIKQRKNAITDWHCSAQERRVFAAMNLI